jgi:predicted double-glycine peptidase
VKVTAAACATILALMSVDASVACADEAVLSNLGGGNYYMVPITSLKGAKLTAIQIQQYDFSCGSAALASLLTYHYRRPVGEKEVFQEMFAKGDQTKIIREGFSMLDMKEYLQTIGLNADGYRVSLDKLADLRVPVITVVETKGYKHFVLIKGIKDDRVLIGDPAAGNRVEKRSDFEAHWDQAVLIVKSDAEYAQSTFNQDRDWSIQVKAPIAITFHQQGLVAGAVASPF